MRQYCVFKGRIEEVSGQSCCQDAEETVLIVSQEEYVRLGIAKAYPYEAANMFSEAGPVLDTHSKFSFGVVNAVEIDGNQLALEPLRFLVSHTSFIIVAEPDNRFAQAFARGLSGELVANRYEEVSPQTVLLYFFDTMIDYNGRHVERIEEKLEELEERVLDDARKEYSREIVEQRKLIMRFRHGIEPLTYILAELGDNENKLFSSAQVKSIRIQANRASKMLDSAILLRDYATQVREAFEAERDIKNNDIMKVFTIVTSLFLPLTLIAGWYGMNFKYMPELMSVYGYPMVIALSVAVVIAMLLFFKRKKWL